MYIYGVRHDTEPRALRKLFEPFGAVTKVDTPFGRLFAFVTMSSRDEAQAAVTALNGTVLDDDDVVSDGRKLQVSFKRQPRTSSSMMSPPPSPPPPAPIKTPPTAYVTSCMQVACVSADAVYTPYV